MMSHNNLREKFKSRELLFGAWISYAHPSITENFAEHAFDFTVIDMEHSTISLEQAQRIIAASQSQGVPCLPRPVSHSNDWIKPLLESGADGIVAPMVNSKLEASSLVENIKYPPIGKRSFGVNRAQSYGSKFNEYISQWNKRSVFMAQIESKQAVENLKEILESSEIDAVMIGPYDLSGSYGQPGNLSHELVLNAEKTVIEVCKQFNVSCGTQLSDFSEKNLNVALEKGYSFIIASSDLFVLNNWAANAESLMRKYRK